MEEPKDKRTVSEGHPSESGVEKTPAGPETRAGATLDVDALLPDEEPKNRLWEWIVKAWHLPKNAPGKRPPSPMNFKGHARQYGYIAAAVGIGTLMGLYFLSTPSSEVEKPQDKAQKPTSSATAPSTPSATTVDRTKSPLIPLTEPPGEEKKAEDPNQKRDGRPITAQDVLKTADEKARAISPEEQIRRWQALAEKYKAEADHAAGRGGPVPASASDRSAVGSNTEARADTAGRDPITWPEFEQDIERYQAEKNRRKDHRQNLAQLQPDFDKVPPLDAVSRSSVDAGRTNHDSTKDAGKTGESAPIPGSSSATPTPAGGEAKSNPLAVNSLIFIREEKRMPVNTDRATAPNDRNHPMLPIATKIKARLKSTVTTAVDMPALAVVEQDVIQDGAVLIPAGSTAFGRMAGASRNGQVNLSFDTILTPENKTIKISGVAQSLNGLGPLKGEVSGKNTGKKLLARTLSGLGAAGALVTGRSGAGSSAFTYGDYMRDRLAYNILSEGDQALARLNQGENVVVSVPANTRFDIILLSTVKVSGED